MLRWYTLLGGNVAEHSFLLFVVAAHSLVSLAFLQSDEFPLIRLQRNGIFQQTAKGRERSPLSTCHSFELRFVRIHALTYPLLNFRSFLGRERLYYY